MSRKMLLVKGQCACCGNEQIIEICDYSPSVEKKLTLSEYFDYIFIGVNVCSSCGYVNDNISELVGKKTKEIVGSEKYKKTLDDGYMDGYKDLPFDEYKKYQGGVLGAFSMLYEAEKINNFKFAKIQNRLYNTICSVRGACFEDRCDSTDGKYDEKYDELIKKLTGEINVINEKCLSALPEPDASNPYEIIFVAECFTRADKYDFARSLIEKVREKYDFDEELEQYIEENLSEIEKL